MTNTKILVVEDENIVALDIAQSLKTLGYDVVAVVASGEEALEKANELQPDLVLMDIQLRGQLDGIETAAQLSPLNVPIVYLTAYADPSTLARAKITEPFGYVIKPFENRELHTTIEMALYKHQADREIREKEEWLTTTLRSIGDAVITTDAAGRITFMNPVAESLTGWRQPEAKGRPLAQIYTVIDEKSGEQLESPITRALPAPVGAEAGPTSPPRDLLLVARDSRPIPIDDSAAPLQDDQGNVTGIVIVFHDITEHKKAEKALQASEKRYRELFEQAQLALLKSEIHNEINRSLISSVSLSEVLQAVVDGVAEAVPAQRTLLHVIDQDSNQIAHAVENTPPEDEEAPPIIAFDSIWQPVVDRVSQSQKPLYVADNVADFWAEIAQADGLAEAAGRLTPEYDKIGSMAVAPLIYSGNLLGTLTAVAHRDVAHKGQGDEELSERDVELMMVIANQAAVAIENARLRDEAEKRTQDLIRSNAELEQFAYIASHDLQEPLRMIKGYTQLLVRRYGGNEGEAEDFTQFILDGVDRMSTLIDDLLTYSRIGFKPQSLEPTDSEKVLRKTLSNLARSIHEHQAQVTYDPLPRVVVDSTQLSQLFQNLISNAIKFRGKTAPRIHISAQQQENCWIFSVADNGIGIAPEQSERIFMVFQRLHNRREYPGTGIGLAICKKIVEGYRGRIWVESTQGEGSTFYFSLCEQGQSFSRKRMPSTVNANNGWDNTTTSQPTSTSQNGSEK